MCYDTGADPLEVAESYALMNGAVTANAQLDDGAVCVDAAVSNESFFAKFLDEDSLDAGAEAVAGCFPPEGKNYVMPIAWSCRPTYVDEEPFDPGLDCKVMALDLAEHRIRVNTICPTFIETPLTKPFFDNLDFKRDTLSRIPLGHLGQLEDIMGAVVYLASPASALVTGSALMVDGGWTAQ